MTVHRCDGRVGSRSTGFFYAVQCTHRGTVKRGESWFCRQHDPVEKEKRDNQRRKKWEDRWAEKERLWKKQDRIARALEACKHACELIVKGGQAYTLARAALNKFPKE